MSWDETLNGALSEPLDKIRAAQLVPDSIAIRILATDSSEPTRLPCRVDTLEDDPPSAPAPPSAEDVKPGVAETVQFISSDNFVGGSYKFDFQKDL